METNWIALVVASISVFLVGWVWYGMIFGKAWRESVGMTEEDLKKGNMPLIMGLSLVVAFIAAFFMNYFINVMHEPETNYHTFQHGALHGAMLAFFTIMPALVTNALYELKSWKYILINVGYWMVSLAVMGGIINWWI